MSAVLATSYTYQRESLMAAWDELYPLFEAHYEEIAYYKDIALNPDKERYRFLEDNGHLLFVTARVDGGLVGYASFFVLPHIHYMDCVVAHCDVIFLLPTYRSGIVSREFFAFFTDELRGLGVQMEIQHIKAKDQETIGMMFSRNGYDLMDMLYTRRLDG